MTYAYPAEKFAQARHSLMLPHPNSETESIFHAFHECSIALKHINKESLDYDIQDQISKLETLMDTDGLNDPNGRGLWNIKAEKLSFEERRELSDVINYLAYWFEMKKAEKSV